LGFHARTYHGPASTHVKRQARVPRRNRASINRRCRVGRAGGGEIVESAAPVRRRSRGYEWHRSGIRVSGSAVHATPPRCQWRRSRCIAWGLLLLSFSLPLSLLVPLASPPRERALLLFLSVTPERDSIARATRRSRRLTNSCLSPRVNACDGLPGTRGLELPR